MRAFLALRFMSVSGVVAMLCACTGMNARVPADFAVQLASFMPAAQQVAPPFGFIGFCVRDKSNCEGGTDKPVNPVLTTARWDELNAVNDYANRLPQVSDKDNYGRDEYWDYASARGGDCEDFALEKRRLLIEKGWPADSLLLTAVREWNGEGHAVLIVVTDRGDYVLDNRNWAIVSWRDAPYTWIKRQSRERPYIWVDIDPHTFRAAAAPVKLPPLGAPVPFLAGLETASIR